MVNIKFLNRLIYRERGVLINPLAHIFFFVTFLEGFAFTFFGGQHSVQATVLFTLTAIPYGLSVWGLAALLVTALNTTMLLTRWRLIGNSAAFAGFGLWFYALIAYASGGFWLQCLAVALPNMLFWTWYYFSVAKFKKRRKRGEVDEV